jgi:glycosyltransferase involved in cell wall biosynthesis
MITPHGDPLGRVGEPDVGGQCVYIRELSAHLAGAGRTVSIYTRDRGEGKPEREEYAPGATVIRVPCGPREFVPKEEILGYLPEFIDAVRSDLEGGETLHSHYWDGGYVAAALRQGRRWFHTTHSLGKLKKEALPEGSHYRYEERIRIETDVYRGCDRVVALTEMERRQIHELYGVPKDQIVVIPPGVDVDRFRPMSDKPALRRKLALPEHATIVFTLGRLDERKGFDLFFEALGRLSIRDDAAPVLFVLSAGTGDPQEAAEREKLQRLIEKYHLHDVLRWLPVLAEETLPDYYAAADVFVLPSRYEPFGIVMLEAMASGVPVVATREGGPSTVIEPGVSGFLVDPTNTSEFAQALTAVIEDADMRRVYGANARNAAETDYSWDAIARRHLVAYGDLAKDGPDAR